MRSLSLKIFLWFWATAIATALAIGVTFFAGPNNVPSRWHAMMVDTARYAGDVAAASGTVKPPSCLFSAGGAVTGDHCAIFNEVVERLRSNPSANSGFRVVRGMVRIAVAEPGNRIFATELPAGPPATLFADRGTIFLRFGVAIFVPGIICFLLARYLTRPILKLREASQQLASGDLSTRAAAGLERRHDELGALVHDFNTMADRVEHLISTQRQLMYDVSHEIRSPLSRLNVALDIARERHGDQPAFEYMQRDIHRLNEMMERLLTVARLDTSSAPVAMAPVNLTHLTSEIVRDADFEARDRDRLVRMTAAGDYFVRGNPELLRSAIENVIRNAALYTAPATPVEVELHSTGTGVLVSIRDHGPGVPDSELTNIFRPFYRIADARDRQSGGAGLGLAIADRIIRLHEGMVQAANRTTGGLEVDISLPALLPSSYDGACTDS
jgi:two-component system sensor histidine kinase CpxA